MTALYAINTVFGALVSFAPFCIVVISNAQSNRSNRNLYFGKIFIKINQIENCCPPVFRSPCFNRAD